MKKTSGENKTNDRSILQDFLARRKHKDQQNQRVFVQKFPKFALERNFGAGFPTNSAFAFLKERIPMGVVSAVLFVVVLLIAVMAALNWAMLTAPAAISIGFMHVDAPLGLVMLGLTAAMGALFFTYVLYLQSSILLEARRHTKQMQGQRDLADKAEASRFTELRSFLETQENTHMQRNAERHDAVLARVAQLEAALKQQLTQSDNTVAAHIGQLEDKLDRRATTLA